MPRTRAPGLSTGRTQDRARPRPAFPPTHGALPGFGAFGFRTAGEGRGSEPKLDPAALDTRLPRTVALAPPGSGRPEPGSRPRMRGCGAQGAVLATPGCTGSTGSARLAAPLRPLPGPRRTPLPEHDPVCDGHVAVGSRAGPGPDPPPPAPWPFLPLAAADASGRPLNARPREHSGQIDCKEEVAETGHN